MPKDTVAIQQYVLANGFSELRDGGGDSFSCFDSEIEDEESSNAIGRKFRTRRKIRKSNRTVRRSSKNQVSDDPIENSRTRKRPTTTKKRPPYSPRPIPKEVIKAEKPIAVVPPVENVPQLPLVKKMSKPVKITIVVASVLALAGIGYAIYKKYHKAK